MPGNQFLVLLAFDRTHVLPVAQLLSALSTQSLESFIADDLVLGRVLKAAFRHRKAAAIDLVHDDSQAVQLSQVLGWQHDASACIDHFGRFRRLDEHLVELASEESGESSECFNGFLGRLAKRAEDKVGGRAPVEVFWRHKAVLGGSAHIEAEIVVSDSS